MRITTHPDLLIHNVEVVGIPRMDRLTKYPLKITNHSPSPLVLTAGMTIATMTCEIAFEDALRSVKSVNVDFPNLKTLTAQWQSKHLLQNFAQIDQNKKHIIDVLKEMHHETSERYEQYKENDFDFSLISTYVQGAQCSQWLAEGDGGKKKDKEKIVIDNKSGPKNKPKTGAAKRKERRERLAGGK